MKELGGCLVVFATKKGRKVKTFKYSAHLEENLYFPLLLFQLLFNIFGNFWKLLAAA